MLQAKAKETLREKQKEQVNAARIREEAEHIANRVQADSCHSSVTHVARGSLDTEVAFYLV